MEVETEIAAYIQLHTKYEQINPRDGFFCYRQTAQNIKELRTHHPKT
jgi:hypothetical protein